MCSNFPGNVLPHDGSCLAWEGGEYDEISYVQQTVSISCPYLAYWHWIASTDACGYDYAGVMLNGSTVVDVYTLCASSSTGGWVKHVVDLSAYVGQTVQLQIRAETNNSYNSSLFVDDVSLQPTAAAAAAVTRSASSAHGQTKPALLGPQRYAAPAGPLERLFSGVPQSRK